MRPLEESNKLVGWIGHTILATGRYLVDKTKSHSKRRHQRMHVLRAYAGMGLRKALASGVWKGELDKVGLEFSEINASN